MGSVRKARIASFQQDSAAAASNDAKTVRNMLGSRGETPKIITPSSCPATRARALPIESPNKDEHYHFGQHKP